MEIKLKLNCFPDLTMDEITKQLFNNEFLSDIQFLIGGKVLYAHWLELMKRSIVFQNQLLLDLGENKLIPVDDVKYESFYHFIQFIYTDVYEVTNAEMGIDVLKLAVKYQVIRLVNKLIDWLTNDPMCLRLFEFCVMENYLLPYNRVKNKISYSIRKCLDDDSFELIHADVLEKILKFDSLKADVTETMLFEAVIRWINKYFVNNGISLENGCRWSSRLLELIRFPTMTLDEFVSCEPKLGCLLPEIDYGIIFKLIVSKSKNNNSKWNSTPRFNFSWHLSYVSRTRPFEINDDRFSTNFTVKNEVLLAGIWFGKTAMEDGTQLNSNTLQLSAKNTETQLTDIIKFRCYTSPQFNCSLNCLGDLILLKSKHEYTIQFIYPEEISCIRVWTRNGSNEVIVSDPTKSVQITNAGIDIFEIIFKNPS